MGYTQAIPAYSQSPPPYRGPVLSKEPDHKLGQETTSSEFVSTSSAFLQGQGSLGISFAEDATGCLLNLREAVPKECSYMWICIYTAMSAYLSAYTSTFIG